VIWEDIGDGGGGKRKEFVCHQWQPIMLRESLRKITCLRAFDEGERTKRKENYANKIMNVSKYTDENVIIRSVPWPKGGVISLKPSPPSSLHNRTHSLLPEDYQ
jgi:hypothetical protein